MSQAREAGAKETKGGSPVQPEKRWGMSAPTEVLLQRAFAAPDLIQPADVLQLQRTIGNRATARILNVSAEERPPRAIDPPSMPSVPPTPTAQRAVYGDTADYQAQPGSRPRQGHAFSVQRDPMAAETAPRKRGADVHPVGDRTPVAPTRFSLQRSPASTADIPQTPANSISAMATAQPLLQPKVAAYQNAKDADETAVGNFTKTLDENVQKAWAIVISRPLTDIEAKIDGYTSRWSEEWSNYADGDESNAGMVPAMVGYAVESISTKLLNNPSPGRELKPILQATRGQTRPDIVLRRGGTDVAWLDITADSSKGHILNKEGGGWSTKPYVAELLYPSVTAKSISENHARFKKSPWDLENTGALGENYLRSRANFLAQKDIWIAKTKEALSNARILDKSHSSRKAATTDALNQLLGVTDLQPRMVGSILNMAGLSPVSYGFRKKSSTGVGYTSQWSKPVPVSLAESLFQDFGGHLPRPEDEKVNEWYKFLKR